MSAPTKSSGDRRLRERGSAIVEAAIVTPVFFMLIFGVLEFGFLFRADLTTTNASRDAARAASVYGRAAETDFLVLQTVRQGLAAIELDQLEFVVVYRLTDPAQDMDPSCRIASQPGVCNRYARADFELALDYTNGNPTPHFRCGTTAVDRFWCPGDRDTSIATADLIGVHVETTHEYITGFFGSQRSLGETTVVRLEPELN